MSFRVYGIEESSVARDLLEQGRVDGRAEGRAEGWAEGLAVFRRLLMKWGGARLRPPSRLIVEAIEGVDDLDRLEALGARLADVSTWEELLGLTAPDAAQG